MSEQTQFLEDLNPEKKTDPFEENIPIDSPEETEDKHGDQKEEGGEFEPKNRRERRLLERLERRGQETSQLADEVVRLRNVVESQQDRTSEQADFLKGLERIYGDATPEAKEATEILKNAFLKTLESATKKAEESVVSIREREDAEVKKESDALDDMMEYLEDNYNIDFSGPDREGYFSLLERVSPKDSKGNIIEYADPDTVVELYLSRKGNSSSKAKDLASRSMTRSGSSASTTVEQTAQERWLRENGLI